MNKKFGNIGNVDVKEIVERCAYHSYFRKGVQYVTINKKEFKVNGLINLLRIWGAL